MNKVELEAKLESLTDEINFLRQIFEEVNYHWRIPPNIWFTDVRQIPF